MFSTIPSYGVRVSGKMAHTPSLLAQAFLMPLQSPSNEEGETSYRTANPVGGAMSRGRLETCENASSAPARALARSTMGVG